MTLQQWMIREGKTREAVADVLGVSAISVGRYVNGERVPRKAVMWRIKSMTQNLVTADDFLSSVNADAA